MKKVALILFFSFLYSSPVFAQELYVKSIKAKILDRPSLRSKVLNVLPRGTKVMEVYREGKWVKIAARGTVGWVSKYLVSKKPPMKRVSLLARGKSLRKTSRRRASAFTSVAAARGLTDYDRARAGRKGYVVDFAALDKIDSIEIDEAAALKFIEKGVSK